jgi:hypothetical protein
MMMTMTTMMTILWKDSQSVLSMFPHLRCSRRHLLRLAATVLAIRLVWIAMASCHMHWPLSYICHFPITIWPSPRCRRNARPCRRLDRPHSNTRRLAILLFLMMMIIKIAKQKSGRTRRRHATEYIDCRLVSSRAVPIVARRIAVTIHCLRKLPNRVWRRRDSVVVQKQQQYCWHCRRHRRYRRRVQTKPW